MRTAILTAAAAVVLLGGCGDPLRTITISGAGESTRITYNCGLDAGAICTDVISAANTDSVGAYTRQVQLPVGATARVTVRGFGSKSCRIADVTDGISYDRKAAEYELEEAACIYRVE